MSQIERYIGPDTARISKDGKLVYPDKKGVKKAAIYARKNVNTDCQDSIENQIAMCKEYCGKNGLEYEVYSDIGSGMKADRPGFEKMMEAVRAKRVSVVVCEKLSRISRSMPDFLEFADELNHGYVEFVSINDGLDTTTPVGKMMIEIALNIINMQDWYDHKKRSK